MAEAIEALKALATGFATTFKHLFRKPITEEYPEYKRPLPVRTRARIILTRDPDGNERCVACYLCSAACPVSCISMQSAEEDNGRRYARWFRINLGRCIYCGFCEEACPVDAILGAAKQMHTVIKDECTGCNLCIPPCPVECIHIIPIEEDIKTWCWPAPPAVLEPLAEEESPA